MTMAAVRTESKNHIGFFAREAAALMKSVGDPARLAVVLALGGGERTAGELTALMGRRQPTASNHLSRLRLGGVVEVTKAGKTRIYRLTELGLRLARFIESARSTIRTDR